MSKAVLVFDMPENCINCKIGVNRSIPIEVCIQCPITGKCTIDVETESRPDWCPMKELPEMCRITGASGQTKDYVNGYRTGWNDCIDIITGGNDNE